MSIVSRPKSALLWFFWLSLQGHKTAATALSITSLQVLPKQERRGVASCMSPTFIREQKIHPRIRGRYWFHGILTVIKFGGGVSLFKKRTHNYKYKIRCRDLKETHESEEP